MAGAEVTTLPTCLDEIRRARVLVQRGRASGSGRQDVRVAQQVLLDALTAYGAALASRRLPLPPAMNDEIRLYRNLLHTRHR